MDRLMKKLENTLRPIALKLDRNIYLSAIKNSLLSAVPLLIAGSLFVLLANFPSVAYTSFMSNLFGEDWQGIFSVCNDISMGMMTIYVIISMARELSASYKMSDAISSTFASLAAFFLATPMAPFADEGMGIGFSLNYLGAGALFTGIIVTIIAVNIMRLCEKKNIGIKMPASVPENVSRSFSSLVPILIVIVVFNIIRLGFSTTTFGSLQNFISGILQSPLTALGATIGATILISIFESLLWFFGINGGNIVGGVMLPIWLSLTAENTTAFANGQELPNIINFQFYFNFIKIGGSGATLALCLLLVFAAKSQQFKAIGKLGLVPQLFNINEPLMFGLPIVLNPVLIISVILVPVVMAGMAYFAMSTGLVPITNGVNIPWTTPPILSGFLVSGWRGALLQVIQILVSIALYYPFFRTADNTTLDNEKVREG